MCRSVRFPAQGSSALLNRQSPCHFHSTKDVFYMLFIFNEILKAAHLRNPQMKLGDKLKSQFVDSLVPAFDVQ
jgi:hypothetical protein